MKTRSPSRFTMVLLAAAIALIVVWHERGAIFDIATKAAQTDAMLDAKDASGP